MAMASGCDEGDLLSAHAPVTAAHYCYGTAWEGTARLSCHSRWSSSFVLSLSLSLISLVYLDLLAGYAVEAM
jgi:hypothetical protein